MSKIHINISDIVEQKRKYHLDVNHAIWKMERHMDQRCDQFDITDLTVLALNKRPTGELMESMGVDQYNDPWSFSRFNCRYDANLAREYFVKKGYKNPNIKSKTENNVWVIVFGKRIFDR